MFDIYKKMFLKIIFKNKNQIGLKSPSFIYFYYYYYGEIFGYKTSNNQIKSYFYKKTMNVFFIKMRPNLMKIYIFEIKFSNAL